MSEYLPACRLTFMLPRALESHVRTGTHSPCAMGCAVTVGRGGLAAITGPSREAVFEHAARFLRAAGKSAKLASECAICGRLPRIVIAARLCHRFPLVTGHLDAWQIIVGADVAFAPGGIDPYLPAAKEGAEWIGKPAGSAA